MAWSAACRRVAFNPQGGMMGIEINWIVVAIRLADGFLYGTGFVLALLIWFGIFKAIPARGAAIAQQGKGNDESI